MKRVFVALLLVFFISCCFFSFAAESSDLPGRRSTDLWFDALNTAKHPVMLKYRTVMDLGAGKERTTVTVSVKDGARCVDLQARSNSVGVLSVGRDTTVMLRGEAIYVKVEAPALHLPKIGPSRVLQGEPDPADYLRSAGAEEIDGKTYDCEEMTFDGADAQTFYFDRETGAWRYWKAGENMLEILDHKNEVDSKVFLVPAWYKEIKDVGSEDFSGS